VREHLCLIGEELRAVATDKAVALLVLGLHVARFLYHEGLQVLERHIHVIHGDSADTLGAPEEVDRGRPGRHYGLGDLGQAADVVLDVVDVAGFVLGPQRKGKGSGHAQRRGASHAK
jgi:hypothetical protein